MIKWWNDPGSINETEEKKTGSRIRSGTTRLWTRDDEIVGTGYSKQQADSRKQKTEDRRQKTEIHLLVVMPIGEER